MTDRPRSLIVDIAAAVILTFVLFVGAGFGLSWIVGEALETRERAVARGAVELVLAETRTRAEALAAEPERGAAPALMVLDVADGRIVAGRLDGAPEPPSSFAAVRPVLEGLVGDPGVKVLHLGGGVVAAAHAADPAAPGRGVIVVVRVEDRLRQAVAATLQAEAVAIRTGGSAGGLALPTPPGEPALTLVWTAPALPGPSKSAFVLVIAFGFGALVVATLALTRTALARESAVDSDRRRLRDRAMRDALTGLGNRARYREDAVGAVRDAVSGGPSATLVVFDLDHFKSINDRHGHQIGDRVIRHAGRQAAAAIGDAGAVYRLGGDEFVLLLRGLADAPAREAMLARVEAAIREPLMVDGVSIVVTASLGAAVAPEHATRADELEALADRAQYAAKRAGRGTFRAIDAAAIEAWRHDRAIEALVRGTVARREIAPLARALSDRRGGGEATLHGYDLSAFERRYRMTPGGARALVTTLGLSVAADGVLLDAVEAQAREGRHLVEIGRETLLDEPMVDRLCALAGRLAAGGGLLTVLLDEADFERRGSSITERIARLTAGGCRLGVAGFGAGNAALRVALRDEVDAVVFDPATLEGPHGPVLSHLLEGLAATGKRVYRIEAERPARRAA